MTLKTRPLRLDLFSILSRREVLPQNVADSVEKSLGHLAITLLGKVDQIKVLRRVPVQLRICVNEAKLWMLLCQQMPEPYGPG